jgi:GTP cyclohydrolase III
MRKLNDWVNEKSDECATVCRTVSYTLILTVAEVIDNEETLVFELRFDIFTANLQMQNSSHY